MAFKDQRPQASPFRRPLDNFLTGVGKVPFQQAAFLCGFSLACLVPALPVQGGQPLETETARLPAAGTGEFESTVEFQTSSAGQELALPLALNYGITDRLEVMVEPVVYTRIMPSHGSAQSGIGDVESTLTYRLNDETDRLPAFAVAGEIKFPTATNDFIGTGKTDYAAYLIASKRFGHWDTHFNLSYATLGAPSGSVESADVVAYAVAVEYRPNAQWEYVAEYITSSSSTGSTENSSPGSAAGPAAAEVAGGETFGTIGLRYNYSARAQFAFGVASPF